MRICHLLAADTTEDDLIVISGLLAALDARRFEQCVASVDGPTADRARQALGLVVRRIELRWGGYAAFARRNWIANWRPNVVHVWSGESSLMTGLGGFDEPAVVISAAPGRLGADGARRRADRLPSGATMICDSRSVRDTFVRRGLDAARCVVVPPGVEAPAPGDARGVLTREALGLAANQPVLLTSGPPSRQGGQYDAVWAAALLQQIFPDVRLIVPGDSPERARLERFVRGFRLPQILICTRHRWPFHQLTALADVFVVPALTDVPTGPIVRAMAAGLPVVSSDVPAMRERIDEATTGLFTPPGEPTQLAGAILRLLDDPELRGRFARAARQQTTEAYPLETCVRQYEAVYEQASGRVGAPSGER